MPVASEFELLCERCGYSIEGLSPDGHCPECGRPIAESLPQRRVGTPAQRSAAVGALLRTVWLAANNSPRLWEDVCVAAPADDRIGRTVLRLAAFLISLQLVLAGVTAIWLGDYPTTQAMLITMLLGFPLYLVLRIALGLLTHVEWWGIQLFARLHGRRITPAIATTIVSHASAGWLVGAALLTPAWLLGRALAAAADHVAILRWELVFVLPTLLPAAAALLGLLLFEIITYTGVLRLRYANREPPAETGGTGVSPVRVPTAPRQSACRTTAKDPAP